MEAWPIAHAVLSWPADRVRLMVFLVLRWAMLPVDWRMRAARSTMACLSPEASASQPSALNAAFPSVTQHRASQ